MTGSRDEAAATHTRTRDEPPPRKLHIRRSDRPAGGLEAEPRLEGVDLVTEAGVQPRDSE